jgi:hypothetical protein
MLFANQIKMDLSSGAVKLSSFVNAAKKRIPTSRFRLVPFEMGSREGAETGG